MICDKYYRKCYMKDNLVLLHMVVVVVVDKLLYQYNNLLHNHYQYMDHTDFYNKLYHCKIHHHYPDNMELL